MSLHKLRWTFIISTIFVLLVVLGFTGGLNVATFKKNYTSSLISSYSVVGGGAVRKIDYAVKYGKPLDNFFGMRELLSEVVKSSQEIKEVQVVLPEGRIAYDLNGVVSEGDLPEGLIGSMNFKDVDEKVQHIAKLYKGEYHTFLPIRDRNGEWIGSLDLIFDEDFVNMRSNHYLQKTLLFMVGLAFLMALLLMLLLFRLKIFNDKGEILEKRLMATVVTVLTLAQVAYALSNVIMFNNAYRDIARENTVFTAQILQKDISRVVEKGVPLEDLNELDVWMNRIIGSLPEIQGIYITGESEKVLYSTGDIKTEGINRYSTEDIYVLPVSKNLEDVSGSINAVFSKDYMDKKIRDIILDAATILVISFFFLFEITIFMIFIIKKRSIKPDKIEYEGEYQGDVRTVRTLAFIMFMGAFMSISFIPVLMRQLYQPLPGALSEGIMIGLPISIEAFCCSISNILAGNVIDKKGWRFSFFLGAVVFCVGMLFSGIAWNTALFIGARAICGIGYGFWLMAMRSFVVSAPTELEKSQNISAMNSGAFAGLNCGAVLGGMLADRIGFSRVFFVALIFIFLAIIFTKSFLKNFNAKESNGLNPSTKLEGIRTQRKLAGFFTDYKVIGFFVLIVIPTAICGMFLEYLFPVFAQKLNLSAANISRAFLLNGMCIVFLGPVLSRNIGKHMKTVTAIIIAGAITACAMLVFAMGGTIGAGYFAAILLGISSSFGVAAHNNYFLKLNSVNTLGEGKALGFYSNVEKFGQMLGPIIFGSIIVVGIAKGVGIVGLAFIVLIAGFILVNRIKKFE